MWPFKRKKEEVYPERPVCPRCGSVNTRLQAGDDVSSPDYIRTWRGQRSLMFRCLDCSARFYADEPPGGVNDDIYRNPDDAVDDEEALADAEEALRKQVEEENDRRFR